MTELGVKFESEKDLPVSGEVVVVFKDGVSLNVTSGKKVAELADLNEEKLGSDGLDSKSVAESLVQMEAILAPPEYDLKPIFKSSSAMAEDAVRISPDPKKASIPAGNFTVVQVSQATNGDLVTLAEQFQSLDAVEVAYVQPVAFPAEVDIAPPTLSIQPQNHFRPAPLGIDMDYAGSIPGARGATVRILDVEGAWRLDHEDLPSSLFLANTPIFNPLDLFQDQHGTAVLGILAAGRNGYGVEGLVPDARIGVATAADVFHLLGGVARGGFSVASVLDDATVNLGPGDVLLIEVQYPGPRTRSVDDFNNQVGMVPVEFYPAEFAAIQRLTDRGVIVVEPAGNGMQDLDDPIYSRLFDRSVRDSGAIMVGAGSAGGRQPMSFTNFGSRVDLQGWGESVLTTGYGESDLRFNGDDRRQWYTPNFGGTSSASPIVAAACASVQGASRAVRGVSLGPVEMRQLLKDTGTMQGSGGQIGPLPDLRRALNALGIQPPQPSGWPQLAGGRLASSPAIARNQDGRLEAVGIGGGGRLYHTWQTAPNNGWAQWTVFAQRLPNGIELRGRPVITRSHDHRLEVYALGSDGAIWHTWQTQPNSGWSGWSSLGGTSTSTPAVGINSDGRLEVFVRWQDGTLHHCWQRLPGSPWSGWSRIGDQLLNGSPAVGSNANGRLEVIVRGVDGLIHRVAQVGNVFGDWTSWVHPGGAITGDPVCTEFGTGDARRLVVFAAGTGGRLFHAWQTAPNNGWSQTDDFGSGVAHGSQVAVCRTSGGGVHLFARGEQGAVLQRDILPPQGWSGWRNLGGRIADGPACFVNADDRPEVLARGVDGLLVHRWGPF